MKNVISKGNSSFFILTIILFLNLIFIQLGLKIGFLLNITIIMAYTVVTLLYFHLIGKLFINISFFLLFNFYGIFLVISFFYSINIQESLAYILRLSSIYLSSILVFCLIIVNRHDKKFNSMIKTIFQFFFYIFILVTLLGYLFFDEYLLTISKFLPASQIDRIKAYYLNGRFGGLGIATGTNCYIIIILSYLGNVYSNKNKLITYLNVLLIFVSILISGARSPIIIWGISLFIFLILSKKIKPYFHIKNLSKKIFKSAVLLLVLILIILNINTDKISNYRSFNFSESESVSIFQRMDLYKFALNQFINSNGLGIGIANIPYRSAMENGVGRLKEVTNTHNIYLQTLAETGVGGFISLIILVLYTLILDIKVIKKFKDNIWLKGIAITSIVFWLYGFISNPLYDYQVLFIFLISKSILLGFISISQNSLTQFQHKNTTCG
jgi:O-antigen ligase